MSELNELEKKEIVLTPEEGLISLHFSYALDVRNKFIWNNYDPFLIFFMYSNAIFHPDDMGGKLVKMVWEKLYYDLDFDHKTYVDHAHKKKSEILS